MGLTRWRAVVIVALALALGTVTAWVATNPGHLATSVPHVVAGWSMVGFGLIGWRQVSWSRCGQLLVLAGFSWFATDLPVCLNIEPLSHVCARVNALDGLARQLSWIWLAMLGHVLITFPSGRADRPLQRAAVVLAYFLALAIPTLPALATPSMALLVVACPTIRYVRSTRDDRAELVAPVVIGAGFAIGLVVMDAVSAYLVELGVTLLVGGLVAGLLAVAARRAPLTADEAVGLGGALAAALRDPQLTVAFASGVDGWVNGRGQAIELRDQGPDLEVTTVARNGQPLARIQHQPQTLADPGIRSAVTLAVELEAHNARLLRELDMQAARVDASRRRLVDAAVRERRELADSVEIEVERPLERLTTDLREQGTGDDRAPDAHLLRAKEQLTLARAEIRDLATGLYPTLLAHSGLRAALEDLGSRTPIPVAVDVPEGTTGGDDIDTTIWFLCAESLANVGRHASAERASIVVTEREAALHVAVSDDGAGGADPARGRGLRALRDRVEAMGGTLIIESRTGMGTRLEATFPVTPEARDT